jgi:hypothetical protein
MGMLAFSLPKGDEKCSRKRTLLQDKLYLRQCLSTGEKEFFEIPRKANYHRISNAGL